VLSLPEALAGGLLAGEQWHLKQQPAAAGCCMRPRPAASKRATQRRSAVPLRSRAANASAAASSRLKKTHPAPRSTRKHPHPIHPLTSHSHTPDPHTPHPSGSPFLPPAHLIPTSPHRTLLGFTSHHQQQLAKQQRHKGMGVAG